jgi:hypothetical protein
MKKNHPCISDISKILRWTSISSLRKTFSPLKQSFMPLASVTMKYESRVERPAEPGTSRLRSPYPLAESSGDPDVDSIISLLS